MSSTATAPQLNMPFETGITLDPGEAVERIIYRHPFDLVPGVAAAVALEGFSLGIGWLMGSRPELVPFPSGVAAAIMFITMLLALLILLISWYVYRHNILIFTSIHLIYVEQVGMFGRRVSQLNFRNVEDVTGHKAGILQTVFNYGDVTVQSAGEQVKFVFRNAPSPTTIADDALQQHEVCLRRAPGAHGSGAVE